MAQGRVLIIAGSDSSGGAGIQADIKTVTCLGGYAATAITALTAQNTTGVEGVLGIDPAFIAQQVRVTASDIGVDAVKTGMLHSADVIQTVAGLLGDELADVPAVIDPVMVAQSGARLLEEEAVTALRETLLPCATVLTPNIPEAEVLTGMTIRSLEEMAAAAEKIGGMGPKAVLLKGGHALGPTVTDVVYSEERGIIVLEDSRIPSENNHGTGCTLASAVATGFAQGLNRGPSISRARAYVREAIRTAPDLGKGNGPLNHGHTVMKFPKP